MPGPLIPGQGRQVLSIFALLSLSDREKCLQDAYGGGEAEEGVQPGQAASPWSGLPHGLVPQLSLVASCPSRAACRCVRCVRLSRGVGSGLSPHAASEQLEWCSMLSPPFP